MNLTLNEFEYFWKKQGERYFVTYLQYWLLDYTYTSRTLQITDRTEIVRLCNTGNGQL